jgi:hypothetical protein
MLGRYRIFAMGLSRRSDAQTSPVGLHLRRYFERELDVTKCWCLLFFGAEIHRADDPVDQAGS